MKLLNGIEPTTNPWNTLLVTGFQLDLVPLLTTLWAKSFKHLFIHLIAYPALNVA